MREESVLRKKRSFGYGITPAHAGRIFSVLFHSSEGEDHPRACGKNDLFPDVAAVDSGSPPRMREESLPQPKRTSCGRITPAHAGRIMRAPGRLANIKDHPRACGKNSAKVSASASASGSPPRMREESQAGYHQVFLLRITPAHAGRIDSFGWVLGVMEDHPRACGKNVLKIRTVSARVGSPPRMREEFHFRFVRLRTNGITPAHAGRIV